jgi:quercetin dioxygenase-like cupin family protein
MRTVGEPFTFDLCPNRGGWHAPADEIERSIAATDTTTEEISMHRIASAGALCAAGLVGALAGVALGQQLRMPPTESKGFRTELLANLDLADEGMAGHQLRMRRITVEPGGQFALHDHRDRPGLFYIQDGTITEYPEGAETSEHGAGQAVAVGSRTRHWEENRGTSRVVVIAVDIVRK